MAAIRLVKGLNSMDMKMLQDIYWGNAAEIRMGQIAASRGNSEWARQFGKEMVEEHTMAQNEIKLLANQKGMSLDNNLPKPMLTAIRRLDNISSGSFDEQFRSAQLAAHAEASNVLQRAIKFGHDQDVRGLAVKMLPGVKMHYSLAKTHQTMMGATAAKHGV